jgi:hypothetical protein
MLAGIRTGKKKRKAAGTAEAEHEAPSASPISSSSRKNEAPVVAASEQVKANTNESIAEQLRRSLLAGTSPVAPVAADPAGPDVASGSSNHDRISSSLDALERRGRVKSATASHNSRASPGEDNDDNMVVVMVPGAAVPPSTNSDAAGLSIQDMVAQERAQSTNNVSLAELEMRHVMRTNKRLKVKLKTLSRQDSDEDFKRQLQSAVPDNNDTKKLSARSTVRAANREQNQQTARLDRQDQITSKCWWWLESSTFARHRLLALGNHVSLVMAPDNLAVVPANHFYIVPLKHTESLTATEDEVWEEIIRFQNCLRAMYAKEQKNVLFCETVLDTTGFWQTKLEAIVVPANTWQDAPLFFKSALTEQAQDWGTHQKLYKTVDKGLRRTVPKNFSYFYLQWDVNHAGYAQMIESADFPRDFGVDTIAGMMEMDPMRFRRNKKTRPEQERQGILEFLEKFKPFDWTVELDK